MSIYKAIICTPNDGTLGTYALERSLPQKLSDEDKYVSAGRDENGQPQYWHVDSLHGYVITKDGILSISSDSGAQIDGLAASRIDVSAGSVLLAMEGDTSVCILGAEKDDGTPAQSAQGPIGRDDPLTDERWDDVIRPTLIAIYPAIEGPLDSYRAAHPECNPLDVWGALIGWMKNQKGAK